MHGSTGKTPIGSNNLTHQRISRLTMEFIDASPERQAQIDQEVEALIDGKVGVLKNADH